MSEKTDEQLRSEINVWRRWIAQQRSTYRMCYWFGGVGAVLLFIGVSMYDSTAGLLWMPGALGVVICIVGISKEGSKGRAWQEDIARNEAILRDRQGRQ